ncbi:hypothetical protein PEDI_53950 [Persicobacter diffluens]|uniref:Tetratricopeptide repeat protein n=2 Tax=Persicobacter diffluens TaxID=981 RepID=A0AAN5AQH9_9BACT|nr:hypothetical protein PEDI_53950 [Persicobacter diffluens]
MLLFACSPEKNNRTGRDLTTDLQNKIAFCPPVLSDRAWYQSENKAPLMKGLHVLNFPVTTNNPLAQAYFNQGLILSYAFNHAEAARSFYYASKLDSSCAMAYWGYAYVLGPNFNAGMSPENFQAAFEASRKAEALITEETKDIEKDLIRALKTRYSANPPADRSVLEADYSRAMQRVFQKYPNNADVAALYAESIMDLHPWDIWDQQGKPKPWTAHLLSIFDQIFKIDSLHPGAHHLYIHSVEASSTPELGLRSARLYDEDLVPGAGHLVHMPAHIYIRTGDYHKGTLSNLRALKVDSAYLSNCYAQGTYPLTLYPHNYHFLSATATLEGNADLAIFAAQQVADHANRQLMKEQEWGTIQHYYTIPYYVKVKFGRWNEILEMKNEDTSLPYPEAIRHYARGMAYLGLKKLTMAENELQKLKEYAKDENLKNVTIWDINTTYDLLQIAVRVLEAGLLAEKRQFQASIAMLQEAVMYEDSLNYQEPPDWFFSVRHALGDVMVKAGRYEEAIRVYQEDLRKLPKNGWALNGLKTVYHKVGDVAQEQLVGQQLETAWTFANVELKGSVIKP